MGCAYNGVRSVQENPLVRVLRLFLKTSPLTGLNLNPSPAVYVTATGIIQAVI